MSSKEIIEYEEELDYEETIQDDEPVPEWHLQLIEERMARYEKEGWPGRPWEEHEKELLEKLDKLLKDNK
jgi:hypothetical protein